MAKDFGIARGQTSVQVATRKYIVKSCFDVQKTILEGDRRFFSFFIPLEMDLDLESVSFCLNNLEISDKMYRQKLMKLTSLNGLKILQN